jgi:pimeloyl-[acyl-carrier protein] methyl ester esterase
VKIECVFIHGWAMNSAVWRGCLPLLPDWIAPLTVDLPGYGEYMNADAARLDEYVEHVAERITRPALLTGWSLGGLVSLKLAQRYPHKVAGLLQVATTPQFVQHGHWSAAIDADVFDQFALSLEKDITKTIQRFLALQVRGTRTSLRTIRELQHAIDERGMPGAEALFAGLRILSGTDLTGMVADLECPVTWLLGDKDALVPVALADVLKQLAPAVEIQVIRGAGHAPFISHPEAFADAVVQAARRV